jgi:hypothetical protein
MALVTTTLTPTVRAAVALSAVAPLGASAGINVQITGTGFDPVASNNTITLTPASGAAVTLVAESITVLDQTKGIRRIGITVPSGLAVGTAAILVRNLKTKESAGGKTLQIVQISLPQTTSAVRGATGVAVRVDGSSNVQFVAGRTTPNFGAGITVTSTQVLSPTSLVATISVSSSTSLGPRTVTIVTSTRTMQLVNGFNVTTANRAPAITSTAVTTAAEGTPYSYQVTATDPDADAVTFRLVSAPAGMTIAAGLISWTPKSAQTGAQQVVVEAMDGRGGTVQQSFQISVAGAPQLQAIDVQPALVRFSAVDAIRVLAVTGLRTDGTTVDLTPAATGTTYESSNTFVARVAPDGVVTGVANGTATITARNGVLSDTAAVVVEAGVTLDSLELAPAATTLRAAGATQALVLRGRFSDGSTRDLTAAAGTTYESGNAAVATVAATGIVSAVANGSTTITARHDTRTATATIAVTISTGTGFLRGEAYDDTRGLPLGQVTVTLLSDGGGLVTTPVDVVSDERGQFAIAGRAGDAVVRISKPGFTPVDRRGSIPPGSSATLVDARLTPIDSNSTLISSALGGQARSHSGRATLEIPPGGLTSDQSVTLTPLSPQGLGALLPAGWSPIAAVAIGPAQMVFGMPLQLSLANAATLAPSTPLVVARYDTGSREWVDAGTATLDPGGLTVRATVDRAGQFAVLVADAAPFTPAEPIPGAPLTGVDRHVIAQTGAAAVGDVVPRSAPPGDDARALGRVGVTTPQPTPSGTLLQARVSERFDLLDQTQVVTQPFTQDLVTYAIPRPATGSLGANFPITPSRTFTIQQLMLGVVRLDVAPFAAADGGDVVGAAGGTISSAEGDTLQIPAGALGSTVPVSLRRVALADVGLTLPGGFDAVAGLQVDMVGASFADAATLSTAATGLSAQDQVLVARAFVDPFGQRRLELVAVGTIVNGRLGTSTVVGTLTLPGVRGGGDYVFLRAQQPVGFVKGIVTRTGGAAAAGVLVTSSSVGLSAVTAVDGGYVVAGSAGVDSTVHGADPSGDGVTATARVDTPNQVVTVNLTLAATVPTVVTVTPAAGTTNVPLDTSVTIDFSEAIDTASVTDATVVLERSGTPLTASRSLSADGRRVVLRPAAPLAAVSTFTLRLTTGIRDLSGNPLSGYAPVSFTTLDPSRPPQPGPGRIIAELPDESGFVLITGAPGVSAGGAVVAIINVRTQETASVLALADGSFRLRISAVVGDELTLILRGADGREQTIAITQFEGADGSTTVGAPGGVIHGPGDRTGTVLPRALASAGTFRMTAGDAASLPALPTGFSYVDMFALSIDGAVFKALTSMTLTESQNRFAPASAFAAPFAAAGELTTPPDALVNSTLRFSATVQNADGVRRTVGGSTLITGASPDGMFVETEHTTDFPTIFLATPREALPGQRVAVRATAPGARVDFDLPTPAGATPADTMLLVQRVDLPTGVALAVVDRLGIDGTRIRTTGRDFPGATGTGDYAVVSTREALVFVTGIVSGPPSTVAVDGLPFVFRTSGPNGRFVAPLRANAAFVLRFFDEAGAARGTATGQAGAGGTLDLGDPLASTAGQLTVSGEPNERSVVDINAPLLLRFSEPIDAATIPAALVVTDDVGSRVFGRIVPSADATSVSFTPFRRWRYGTRYRYGVATTALARSGARLRAPFSASFTTFQPSVVGSLPIADARDVAVAGATAVVATAAGITTVDVSSPRAPRLVGQVAIPGGAHGVNAVATPTITDRNGQSITTPIALVAAGGTPAAGALRSFDLSTPAAPTALGSTQLTAASGQPPPANVPGFGGVPLSVTSTVDGQAVVAIEGVGVSSLQVGQAIPVDTSVPARGAGVRYPSAGVESANDVVRLGDRVLVAGVVGLTVLDASLQRVGGVSTTGNAQGVAAIPAFRMDVNGDGAVDPASEVFDLAVVANGIDGTLQFYRVPAVGDPVLLSAVRFNGAETSDVQVDATERLAYVALGGRGLAIVDLDGPASVQPIDVDRNGVDDRVLGQAATAVVRLTLHPARGLGYAADTGGRLAALQLRAPRTNISSLVRNPVRVVAGDEQSIAEDARAFLTDDEVWVTIDVQSPSGEPLVLSIDEAVALGEPTVLRFDNGSGVAPLADGLNELSLTLAHYTASSPRNARLQILSTSGAVVASRIIRLDLPDYLPTNLEALQLGPNPAAVTPITGPVQIGVAGFFSDGRVFNLTTSGAGTLYDARPPQVATVSVDGLVTGLAGGRATVTATNGARAAALVASVDGERALVALRPLRNPITLRTVGEEFDVPLLAEYSDGTTVSDKALIDGLFFTSSASSIIVITPEARLRAVAAGTATVVASVGATRTELQVSVDPRTPPTISGIRIVAVPDPLPLDFAPLFGRAVVSGTGGADGVPVAVTLNRSTGVATGTVVTDIGGAIDFRLDDGSFAGPVSVSVSVVDPATGATFSDSAAFIVAPATRDDEPNDTPGQASPLRPSATAIGTIAVNGDGQDTYRFDSDLAGTLHITVRAQSGGSFAIVVRNAAGQELARRTPLSGTQTVSVPVPTGSTFVTVEALSGATSYRLTSNLAQSDVVVESVSPMAGNPSTLVTIAGSGFSTRLDQNQVFFSGMTAEVVTASSTVITARVPANAVNGDVEVTSGDRTVRIPGFSTGNASVRPPAYVLPEDPALMREDPSTGTSIDISRLLVEAAPSTSTADMTTLAGTLGGSIAGIIPLTNEYVFEFAANRSFDTLTALRRQVSLTPGIRNASFVEFPSIDAPPSWIDSDQSGFWNNSTAQRDTLEQIKLFDAINLIRTTPPFDDRDNLRDVRVAVMDTGFKPPTGPSWTGSKEFLWNDQPIAQFLRRSGLFTSGFQPSTVFSDAPRAHGTQVASVIAAVNDGNSTLSGVLNSVADASEQPFPIYVYGLGGTDDDHVGSQASIAAALDHIRTRSDVHIDVVNMSFGYYSRGCSSGVQGSPGIRALRGYALVVASAGNDGVNARCHFPSAYSVAEPHVISVGAVAVGNVDASGETADDRAAFGQSRPPSPASQDFARCSGAVTIKGSNCGNAVTLAAPGEDVLALTSSGYTNDFGFRGTSAAAPIVTGVAALLQAIRPTAQRLPPSQIRSILTSTATDITGPWDAGDMIRVDAVAAAEALLPSARKTAVYVADQEAPTATAARGGVVAVDVDPVTAAPVPDTGASQFISLKVTVRGQTITAERPRTIAVTPDGRQTYVLASAGNPWGDGLVVIDTRTKRALDFIPLSGAAFPWLVNTPMPPAVRLWQTRPPMVFSRDGRLLYVSTGYTIAVVNTMGRKVVKRYRDLPSPYRALAQQYNDRILERLEDLERLVLNSGVGPLVSGGGSITSLDLSPDGRTLVVLINTGRGNYSQPGFVIAVDVDLYHDADPGTRGLQSALGQYLALRPQAGVQQATRPASDEPSDLAVSPDGRWLYVVNDGAEEYSPAGFDPLTLNAFAHRVYLDASGNTQVDPNLEVSIRSDLADGAVLVNSTGMIDVFGLPGLGQASLRYQSDVNYGWLPSAASGGLVMSPMRFGPVFSKLPTSIAVRPDGMRALVSYSLTGNFGLLDRALQEKFSANSPARTGREGPFTGVIGVTPAIQLDKTLWPSRGSFETAAGPVPSPDERLAYAGQIEYAQGGRFAAAVHTGKRLPDVFNIRVPDFSTNERVRRALVELGFDITPGATTGTNPATGETVTALGELTIHRGGGAVSIINDSAITEDGTTHAGTTEPNNGVQRPYYALYPICAVRGTGAEPTCERSAVTSLYDYVGFDGTTTPFSRPVGLSIAPILQVLGPRFGDEVRDSTNIRLAWSGQSITRLEFALVDLDDAGPAHESSVIGDLESPYVERFDSLLSGAPGTPGHRYRLTVKAFTSGQSLISTESIDVRFRP